MASSADAVPVGSVEEVQARPPAIQIENITVKSLDPAKPKLHTRDHVFETMMKPLIKAKTPEEWHRELAAANARFVGSGAFKEFRWLGGQALDNELPRRMSMEVGVTEVGITATTGAGLDPAVDGRPASLEAMAEISMKNKLGYAESISASYAATQTGHDVIKAQFSRPTLWDTLCNVTASVYQDSTNLFGRNSSVYNLRGAQVKVGKEDSPHSVSYQCEWREFMPGQRQPGSLESVASEEVVRQSLPSVKSSVAYDWYKDLRRLDGTPLSGVRTTAHAEIAGIGGDVRMFRGEVSAERNWTWQRTLQADGSVAGSNHWRDVWMSPGITLALAGTAGLVVPIAGGGSGAAGSPWNTALPDRFTLGGTRSLRGFADSGVGPRASAVSVPSKASRKPNKPPLMRVLGSPYGDSLGGNQIWHASARLLLPPIIPWGALVRAGVRTQGFFNIGNLTSDTTPSNTSPLVENTRMSAGVGFVIPLPGPLRNRACLELNFPLWSKHRPHDVTTGLQIGFTM